MAGAEPRERPRFRLVGSPVFHVAVLALLIGAAIARIVLTYSVFTQTYDEPYHVAAGMEWLDKGTYTYGGEHGPLARVAVALGPYLRGLRSHGQELPAQEGNAILFSADDYFINLSLARLGSLPFLFLGCVVVYLWGRRWFGPPTALFAVMLFTSLPPILGHAGLATTDMAATATIAAALFAFIRWVETPDYKRAILFGITIALACLSKFSSFLFLPACFGTAIVGLELTNQRVLFEKRDRKQRIRHLAMAALVAFLLIWTGYRFDMRPLSSFRGGHDTIDRKVANPFLRQAGYALLEFPLPLTEIIQGLSSIRSFNVNGHPSYLLGEYRKTGWWYFFPIVLAVKTPIGFLFLAIAGLAIVVSTRSLEFRWQRAVTALFPIVVLLMCLPSHINLGVRHLLPIYPMLSVLAGYALSVAVGSKKRILVAAGYLLAAWVVVESIGAHPDYVAAFNQFAGRHPERILAESDLDWGQDLHRLVVRLKSLGINEVGVEYFGTAPLNRVGLPSFHEPSPITPSTGYIAISVRFLTLEHARNGSYDWLKEYAPLERIGKSIYLFHISPN